MKKHGRYNEQKHLPDNTGQPTGDGSRVWLMEAVRENFPDLVHQAEQQRGDSYSWLVKQLRAMDNVQATAIAEEYRSRINADKRERAQRDRKRRLAQYEKLAQTCDVEQLDYIEKCIAKLQKQIAEVEQ